MVVGTEEDIDTCDAEYLNVANALCPKRLANVESILYTIATAKKCCQE